MNYLGAESARYQLRNHNFLSNIEFNLECPPFIFSDPEGRGIKPLKIRSIQLSELRYIPKNQYYLVW